MLEEHMVVPRSAVDWMKRHYPVLCEKSGLDQAAPIPVDWQLVPVRPTPEMIEATFTVEAGEATRRVQRRHRANLYRKMLEAARNVTPNAEVCGGPLVGPSERTPS